MGIRMLHRRTARARTQAQAADAAAAGTTPPRPPVPAFAADASTARIPTDLAMALRHTAADLRRRLTRREPPDPRTARAPATTPRDTPVWRLWADLGRSYLDSYLALVLARLPKAHPVPTMTVFIARRTDGSAPR